MMLEEHLQEKLGQIRLWRPSDQITIENPTDLQIIGRGQQGVVFRIDEMRCVKKYYQKRSRILELRALRLGAKAGIKNVSLIEK